MTTAATKPSIGASQAFGPCLFVAPISLRAPCPPCHPPGSCLAYIIFMFTESENSHLHVSMCLALYAVTFTLLGNPGPVSLITAIPRLPLPLLLFL